MAKTAKTIEADKASVDNATVAARPRISEQGRKWLEENAEAIKSINEWVEKNGLPLEKYRMF
jgi:post-segregation antitoxin (ccd killing protein)